MRFASLGSGSEGNALLVQAGSTLVMLDCGFSLQETELRLSRLGVAPSDLSAVVVTHEHGDHCAGVPRLARKYGLPVWLTHGTLRARASHLSGLHYSEISPGCGFSIGDLTLMPFPVPHDGAEPVQFVFQHGVRRLGVLTDTGHVTPHIEAMLKGCDALVLEFNHDEEMLAQGPYPPALKRRVGGHYGHLSNRQAARLLASLDMPRLQHLVAAHLSSRNNSVERVWELLRLTVGLADERIAVADQIDGLAWRDVI